MSLRAMSLLATVVLMAAMVTLLLSHSLFAHGALLVSLQVAAALLMLWSRLAFGARSFHAGANPTQGGLVTTGPYRWIRHPIYSSVLLFLWAGVAANFSIRNAVVAVVATAGFAVRIASEERLVLEKYPEYADYARRTRRIIPFVI